MNPFFKIHEYVKNIKKAESGFAKDVPELFEKLIKFQFKNTETIVNIHNSLMDYINSPNAIFFIRKYGSFSPNKYNLLRRGFMSEYSNNIKTVFCDNTFTELFTAMKLSNLSYKSQDLHNLFNQEKLVIGFGHTSKEKQLSFYKQGKKINITSKGWYTAHIKPVGQGYEGLSINELFPNPDRIEYKNERKIRMVNSELSRDELRLIKAHFLRLIHPFNSFLAPAKRITDYSKEITFYEGSLIGEENELILYVRNYIKDKFPDEFNEFDKLTLNCEFQKYSIRIRDIHWNNKKKNKSIRKTVPKVNLKKENVGETINRQEGEIKIAVYIKSVFSEFFEKSMLSSSEIENLKNPSYSKETFKIKENNLAILRDIKEGTKIKTKSGRSHNRYWKDVFDGKYHIFSQWYETEQNKVHRESFKKWEVRIRNMNITIF